MASNPPVSPELSAFLNENGLRGREMLLPALLEAQKTHDYIPAQIPERYLHTAVTGLLLNTWSQLTGNKPSSFPSE